MPSAGVRVAVVGGGIIGLSIAAELLARGADVTVFDASPDGGDGAWHVAAGMLAPGGESAFEYPHLTRLLEASHEMWPEFAASLGDIGYDTVGTLSVALTADDVAEAGREWRHQKLTPLSGSQVRDREPAISPRVRAGAFAAHEHQVDPRKVVAALRKRLAGRIVARRIADLSEVDAGSDGAAACEDAAGSGEGAVFEAGAGSDAGAGAAVGAGAGADVVVVAAGAGTAALTGLPIRPVKGQVLRLRGEPGLLRHVIDGAADGRHVYLVPRAGGEVVVGATQEELADSRNTAGGVYDLLRAALDLVPGLAEHELAEVTVGHRPGTPDNGPILGLLDRAHRPGTSDNGPVLGLLDQAGRGAGPVGGAGQGAAPVGGAGRRIVVAAGHFRNGILLAPITARLIADLVLTGSADPIIDGFAPGRFR